MRKEDITVDTTYYFTNMWLPAGLPKKVKVIDIVKNVIRFDEYVGNETYADINTVCDCLFEKKEDAERALAAYIVTDEIHFIHDYICEELLQKYPEVLL